MYQLEEEVVWKPLEQKADGQKWGSRTDIKDKPGRYVPVDWVRRIWFQVVDKETRLAIEICDEESENNINGEENIDNVVNNEESVFLDPELDQTA
ncbi:hypothetical protein LINPERHAP2_LOCUS14902 [Linum perenne]